MIYKLIVNAIEIYHNSHDTSPKFFSKNDLVDFKVENNSRVILTFKNLGRVHSYTFDDVSSQEITQLKDFFGI